MVVPTGIPDKQQLMVLEKSADGKLATREVLPVRFSELEEGETPPARRDRAYFLAGLSRCRRSRRRPRAS